MREAMRVITEVRIPLTLKSTPNMSEHRMVKAKRAKSHRGWAKLIIAPALARAFDCNSKKVLSKVGAIDITLHRIGKNMMDPDNCIGAFKNLRDGVADALGVPDNDKRITWHYSQLATRKEMPSIIIKVEGVVNASAQIRRSVPLPSAPV